LLSFLKLDNVFLSGILKKSSLQVFPIKIKFQLNFDKRILSQRQIDKTTSTSFMRKLAKYGFHFFLNFIDVLKAE